jgi:hypothetical protein
VPASQRHLLPLLARLIGEVRLCGGHKVLAAVGKCYGVNGTILLLP